MTTDLYLECVRTDINLVNEDINKLETKYRKDLNELKIKLQELKHEEDKIMKRTHNLDRCIKCDKFGCEHNNCKNVSLDLHNVKSLQSEYQRKLEDLKGDEDIIMARSGLTRCENCQQYISSPHFRESQMGDYYTCKGKLYG